MLNLLKEVYDAADLVKPAPDPLADPDKPAPKPKEEIDNEWEDFKKYQRDYYKEILEDEGVAIQACAEVRQRVESMREIVALEREALLPTKLAQLANRFESQEAVCQRMIRRAKDAITVLRGSEQDYDEDDKAHLSLVPVRRDIAKARSLEFKELVRGFFAVRSRNREDMMARASRQLRFAYPDALEEEIKDVMEFPELAFVAISRRLENGTEASLEGILGEMEGKKADAKKLEQGAKELKLMFLQFEELIDAQGENLTVIEANIKTVIEETTEAIGVLIDAEQEKRAYERKLLKFYVLIFLVGVYFCSHLMYTDPDRYGVRHYTSFGYVVASIFWPVTLVWKRIKKLGYRLDKDIEGGSAPSPPGAPKIVILDNGRGRDQAAESLIQRATNQNWFQVQEGRALTAEDAEPIKRRKPLSGFIPRREPLLDAPVLRAVAVRARGGATRHSALRKSREKIPEENSTDSSQ